MKRPVLFSALFFLCLSTLAQLSPTDNIVITLAGTGTGGFNGDNIPATSAQVSIQVDDIIYDNLGNLFIADLQNYRVRKIDAQSGLISTVAGNGVGSYSGDGGLATSAGIQPLGLALDGNGLLYICDWNRIRVVNLNTGIINTFAGTGNGSYNGDNIQAGLANINPYNLVIDSSGDVIFVDRANARIRKIDIGTGIVSTIAGDGTGATTGDGGPANLAQFQYPSLIRLDNAGNMYVSGDFSNRVRKIDIGTGIVTTVAGNGVSDYTGDGGLATNASIKDIEGFITDNNGNIYIGSMLGRRLRKVDANSGIISTIAGTGNYGFNGDGIDAITANVMPKALAFDLVGNLTLVDAGSHRIRQLQPAAPATFTIPDPNFSAFLNTTYPSIMSGNELDIAGAALVTGFMDCGNQNISDLSGIEYFTGITELICWNNNLTTLDISTLDLQHLRAKSNNLTSVTGLANQVNMQFLWLGGNELTDVSDIAGLSQLWHLSINKNQLTDFPSLDNFPGLVECSVGGNPIPPGVLDVSGNPAMRSLECSDMNLTGISGLPNTDLTYLNCNSNSITDLSDLQSLTNMITIWASSNQLSGFPTLSSWPTLVDLQVSNNPLPAGLMDVSGNPDLIIFRAQNTNLTGVTGLQNTIQLQRFEANINQLTDVSDLQSISTLERVWVANNQLTTFPTLSLASNLKELSVQGNSYANWNLDLSPNPQLVKLSAQISNIDAIIGLSNAVDLVELHIEGNNLTDLPDMSNQNSLTKSRIHGNKLDFSDAREIRILNSLPSLTSFIYHDQQDFEAVDELSSCLGELLEVSIQAQDSATSYQWYKDGVSISGATASTYTIASFSASDVGIYSCRSYGSALDYPSPMNFGPGITYFQSEPINVIESQTGCSFPLLLVDVTSPLNDCGYNIGCNGALTGSATISYVGGAEPFSVLWSDGQSAETAINLAAGDYTVTVTDANSSQITGEITITEADAISVTYDSSAPICEDSFTGAIDVTVTGGCTPYEFSWTGPDGYTASSEDVGLLSPGIYTLDVMDAQGCHSLTDVTIGSLPSPEVQIAGGKTVFLGYDPMACADLSAVVSGGSGSSTILWSTGDTDADITVCPQTTTTYSVTVTDSNGCSNTIEILIPVIDVICGNNGDKVQICHVPNGDLSKAKTLCVSPNAVQAHLNKGDFLGSCDGTTTIDGYQPFVLNIYANPFLVTTQVQYEVFEEGTISIQVYDNQGFLLETPVSEFSTTGTYQFTFDRSPYSGNTFYLVANYQGHETISNTYTLLGL